MPTELEIQTAINNLAADAAIEDVLTLAIDTDRVTTDRVIVVPTVDDLPDLLEGKIASGTIFFVDQYKIAVVASVNKWVGLDARLLRRDYSISTIYGWGSNQYGQLGDNTTEFKSSPVSIVGGITSWCNISSGYFHTLGVTTCGTAWAWGSSNYGQLGDGTTVAKSSPVSVLGGFTDWCQVSSFNYHSTGVRCNGTAWAWGSNGQGRLGDGTTTSKSSPVSVIGGFTDWCQVVALGRHSLGIRTNGTAWAWGANNYGQLGDGTVVNKTSPVSVVGGFTNWCQVSGGFGHNLGIRTNGTLWVWGRNNKGQIGDGTIVNQSSPVSVVGGFTDWCQVAASGLHSVGVRQNGTAWAWGYNLGGQLGDGTINDRSSPVSVMGGFTDWCQVSAGSLFTLGVRQNGTAWAWGYNGNGRLGDGTTVSKRSPVLVAGGLTGWCQVSAGFSNSMAINTI